MSSKTTIYAFILTVVIRLSVSTQCGTNSITKRIIGGEETLHHEFPWQAAIRWRVGITAGKHVCGGSLIHENYVLTAAHCFVQGAIPLYYDVTLGDHDSSSLSSNEQVRNIKRIIIHEYYDEVTYDNDIALIELSAPARLNKYVNIICLPDFIDFEFPGMLCTIIGWGDTDMDNGKSPTVLHKVQVPIVNYRVCNHDRSYAGKLTSNMFCAGYPNGTADTCQGDSGGPIQCRSRRNNAWLLNGVTSWGKGCGQQHKYGVYVVVRHFVSWINQITRKTVPPIPPIPKTMKPLVPPIPTWNPIVTVPQPTIKPVITVQIKTTKQSFNTTANISIPPNATAPTITSWKETPIQSTEVKKILSHTSNTTISPNSDKPLPTRKTVKILYSKDGKAFLCQNIANTKSLSFLWCRGST